MSEEISLVETLDGKRIVHLTGSHLNEYQKCPTSYNHSMVENLRMLTTPSYFSRGSFMHKVLEHYYRGKLLRREKDPKYVNLDHGQIISTAIEDARFYAVKENMDSSTVNEVLERLELYFKKYYSDGWEPIFVEQPFSKVLFEDEKLLILYEGQIDLIIRNMSGSVVPVDHKGESRKSVAIGFLNQFTGYAWVTGSERFIVNKVGFQTSIKDTDKILRREELHIPFEKQEEWVEDSIVWVRRMLNSKDTNYWSKNRTSCDKYGRCAYLPICESTRAEKDSIIAQGYTIGKPHDPMGEESEE